MAKKRYISDSIWTDTWFEQQTPEKKLLFMYLLTNKLVSICGFYELAVRQIAFDTGIWIKQVTNYLEDFEADKKVFYNNGMICIVNFVKNQNITSEQDKLWIGIKREVSELWTQKLALMLDYKDLRRTLQGAYKDLDIPYLTLLNLTSPDLTLPDLTFSDEKSEKISNDLEIVSIEKTTEIQTIKDTTYTDSIQALKANAIRMDNGEKLEIPDYAQNYAQEWFKFTAYWTERDKKGRIRAEMQKTFEIKRRFGTWMQNKGIKTTINPITRIWSL